MMTAFAAVRVALPLSGMVILSSAEALVAVCAALMMISPITEATKRDTETHGLTGQALCHRREGRSGAKLAPRKGRQTWLDQLKPSWPSKPFPPAGISSKGKKYLRRDRHGQQHIHPASYFACGSNEA